MIRLVGNQHVLSRVATVDVGFQSHFGVGRDFLFRVAPSSHYGDGGTIVNIWECTQYKLKCSYNVWRAGA